MHKDIKRIPYYLKKVNQAFDLPPERQQQRIARLLKYKAAMIKRLGKLQEGGDGHDLLR